MWFKMPLRWLHAFGKNMIKIRAEERLSAIAIGQASAGLMKRENARSMIDTLERQANHSGGSSKPKGKALVAALSAIGIQVVRVKKEKT